MALKNQVEIAVSDLFFQHQFVAAYSQWMALGIVKDSPVPSFYLLWSR